MRRTKQQVAADRAAIVAALPGPDEVLVTQRDLAQRLGRDVRQADLAALADAGVIEREVRKEWDTVYQPHFGNGMTNSVRRVRAYYRKGLN
jgi:hypothetical protein